jgi:DNA/RNA endonuclease YhcR with UshA esterase domain
MLLVIVGLLGVVAAAAEDDKALTPEEARKQVGKTITVQMQVRAAKDRLEKRGEVYLDAQEDFRDLRNFAVVITRKGAAGLKEKGIDDPAAHFKGKTIRAKGTVKEVQDIPRIEVDDPAQVRVVEKE